MTRRPGHHFPRSGLGRTQPVLAGPVPDVEEQVLRAPRWLQCTPTELRVLELAADGYSAAAAAEILGRSATTVRDHRSHLLRKIGARNMPHAVALAYQDGLLAVSRTPAVTVGGVEYQPTNRLAA